MRAMMRLNDQRVLMRTAERVVVNGREAKAGAVELTRFPWRERLASWTHMRKRIS